MNTLLFPRKLRDRLRNAALLCLLLFGVHCWSGDDTRYIRHQRDVLLALGRNQQAADVRNRPEEVRKRCATFEKHKGSSFSSPGIKELYFPDPTVVTSNIFYCPVTGAASTFLTRYILVSDDLDEKSPFDIPPDIAKREILEQHHSLGTDPRRQQFLSQAVKFVFVRNPFSRIFSLYLEKLFSPNIEFWGKWGQSAISLSGLDSNLYPCGAFVSFRHFIKLVVKELWKTDANLMPVATRCQLCKIFYDVIGKAEFSMSDLRFLSEKLNVTTKFMTQPKYMNDATHDLIKDVTRNAFGKWNREIKNCMSSFDMGRIIWRKLQIVGVIDSRLNFPLSMTQMDSMSRKEFRDLCLAAAKKSLDKNRLRIQRYESMVEAYKTVDLPDLEALQGIYARDFYLLGYDYNPLSIFTKKKVEGDSLVYSKLLDWRTTWERYNEYGKEVKVKEKDRQTDRQTDRQRRKQRLRTTDLFH